MRAGAGAAPADIEARVSGARRRSASFVPPGGSPVTFDSWSADAPRGTKALSPPESSVPTSQAPQPHPPEVGTTFIPITSDRLLAAVGPATVAYVGLAPEEVTWSSTGLP